MEAPSRAPASTYAAPIRRKADGVWRNIDTALTDEGSALEPEVAAADTTVPDGGDTALASVTKGTKSFRTGVPDTHAAQGT